MFQPNSKEQVTLERIRKGLKQSSWVHCSVTCQEEADFLKSFLTPDESDRVRFVLARHPAQKKVSKS